MIRGRRGTDHYTLDGVGCIPIPEFRKIQELPISEEWQMLAVAGA